MNSSVNQSLQAHRITLHRYSLCRVLGKSGERHCDRRLLYMYDNSVRTLIRSFPFSNRKVTKKNKKMSGYEYRFHTPLYTTGRNVVLPTQQSLVFTRYQLLTVDYSGSLVWALTAQPLLPCRRPFPDPGSFFSFSI